MRLLVPLVILAICLAPRPIAGAEYAPLIPDGAEKFTSAKNTQAIGILDERDFIRPVPITALESKWQSPGGLEGVQGWTQQKYRFVPSQRQVRRWIGNIGVRNSSGYIQQNRGLLRDYPDGTRFDEVLTNSRTGVVFEHRVREKIAGVWKSEVHHKDEENFPTGYTGLKVTCSSCHGQAGSGEYGVGLIPGGDTVLSDPLLDSDMTVQLKTDSPPIPQPTIPQPMPPNVDPKNPKVSPIPMMVLPAAPNTIYYLVPNRGLFGRTTYTYSACAPATVSACAPASACGSSTTVRQRTVFRVR